MATVDLPVWLGATEDEALTVRRRLDAMDIEVPVHPGRNGLMVRLSAQIYCDLDDFERLAEAVLTLGD